MTVTTLPASKVDLDTPALCLDLDTLQANIAAAVALCRQYGVDWRPHAKCHKCPDIARLIVEAGAIGLTCAKLGEAEVFAAAGIRDLLIANILVGRQKIARLVELRKIADPIICLDHVSQAEPISHAMAAAGLRAVFRHTQGFTHRCVDRFHLHSAVVPAEAEGHALFLGLGVCAVKSMPGTR